MEFPRECSLTELMVTIDNTGLNKLTTINHLLRNTSALTFFAFSCLAMTCAYGQSTGTTGASQQMSVGTVSILAAPVLSVVGSTGGEPSVGSTLAGMGSVMVVSGIAQAASDSVDVILDASSGAGKASVRLGRSAFEKLGVSVGTTVQVVAESTGVFLIASGKLLAFIPNTVGESLLFNQRVPGVDPE